MDGNYHILDKNRREEMLTLNHSGLSPTLTRCLATTNIIESPNGGV